MTPPSARNRSDHAVPDAPSAAESLADGGRAPLTMPMVAMVPAANTLPFLSTENFDGADLQLEQLRPGGARRVGDVHLDRGIGRPCGVPQGGHRIDVHLAIGLPLQSAPREIVGLRGNRVLPDCRRRVDQRGSNVRADTREVIFQPPSTGCIQSTSASRLSVVTIACQHRPGHRVFAPPCAASHSRYQMPRPIMMSIGRMQSHSVTFIQRVCCCGDPALLNGRRM